MFGSVGFRALRCGVDVVRCGLMQVVVRFGAVWYRLVRCSFFLCLGFVRNVAPRDST